MTAPVRVSVDELAATVREGLIDGNEFSCDCDRPGNPSACINVAHFEALAELVRLAGQAAELEAEIAELRDHLKHAEWVDHLMTAQRDEAFKLLTREQRHECIRVATASVRDEAYSLISPDARAALAGSPPEPGDAGAEKETP